MVALSQVLQLDKMMSNVSTFDMKRPKLYFFPSLFIASPLLYSSVCSPSSSIAAWRMWGGSRLFPGAIRPHHARCYALISRGGSRIPAPGDSSASGLSPAQIPVIELVSGAVESYSHIARIRESRQPFKAQSL